ncbi:MAG: DUF2889 domain-containing protein [Elstera sp.]
MPLSAAAPRTHFHTRTITLDGYHRTDGLWDVEAHLVDTKAYAFDNAWRGRVEPGEAVHEMHLRLTVDDRFTVVAVEAVTDHSPFEMCPAIVGNFQRIVGLTIGPGWTKAVKERVGGTHGCTHLVELLGPLATVAFQTIAPGKERLKALKRGDDGGVIEPTDQDSAPSIQPGYGRRRPPILDTCHALASDSPVVAHHYPEFYTGDVSLVSVKDS